MYDKMFCDKCNENVDIDIIETITFVGKNNPVEKEIRCRKCGKVLYTNKEDNKTVEGN